MLTEVFWFIRALYISVGGIMKTIFFTIPIFNGPGELSSTFWSLIFQLIVVIIGSVVFVITVYWYQGRQKGDNYHAQTVVEEYYERMLDNADKEEECMQHQDYYNSMSDTITQ